MRALHKHIRKVLLMLLVTGVAHAQQDADLKSGNIRPRTALMSEEVARQKLLVFGLEQLSSLSYVDGRYVARVQHEGRAVEVEIDLQSGVLRKRGQPLTLAPLTKAPTPTLSDYTLKIEREDIARAPLVIEPLVPERPQVIRPLGDEPIKEKPERPPSTNACTVGGPGREPAPGLSKLPSVSSPQR